MNRIKFVLEFGETEWLLDYKHIPRRDDVVILDSKVYKVIGVVHHPQTPNGVIEVYVERDEKKSKTIKNKKGMFNMRRTKNVSVRTNGVRPNVLIDFENKDILCCVKDKEEILERFGTDDLKFDQTPSDENGETSSPYSPMYFPSSLEMIRSGLDEIVDIQELKLPMEVQKVGVYDVDTEIEGEKVKRNMSSDDLAIFAPVDEDGVKEETKFIVLYRLNPVSCINFFVKKDQFFDLLALLDNIDEIVEEGVYTDDNFSGIIITENKIEYYNNEGELKSYMVYESGGTFVYDKIDTLDLIPYSWIPEFDVSFEYFDSLSRCAKMNSVLGVIEYENGWGKINKNHQYIEEWYKENPFESVDVLNDIGFDVDQFGKYKVIYSKQSDVHHSSKYVGYPFIRIHSHTHFVNCAKYGISNPWERDNNKDTNILIVAYTKVPESLKDYFDTDYIEFENVVPLSKFLSERNSLIDNVKQNLREKIKSYIEMTKKKRDKENVIEELNDDIEVSLNDSLEAGNCKVGTESFIRDNSLI